MSVHSQVIQEKTLGFCSSFDHWLTINIKLKGILQIKYKQKWNRGSQADTFDNAKWENFLKAEVLPISECQSALLRGIFFLHNRTMPHFIKISIIKHQQIMLVTTMYHAVKILYTSFLSSFGTQYSPSIRKHVIL